MLIAHETAPELNSAEWTALERILSRFEDERKRGAQPALEDYLPAVEHMRHAALFELVYTDLEYRLKDGEPARVEQYLHRFPELKGDPASELELIRAELIDRGRREPDLTLGEFLVRFPQHDAKLRATWKWMNQTGATLSRICGQCHEPFEVLEIGSGDVLVCRACGAELLVETGTSSSDPRIPSPLGRYELLDELGSGNFGIVYRAHDTELDRIVAVKILRPAHRESPASVYRFLREARAVAQLEHPHIVPIFDFDREGKTCYLVYAFVPGTTLAAQLAAGRLPFGQTAALIARVAEALDYAHRQGVIHRDVKPANILLDRAGGPHLTDFGLARRDSGEITMTLEGTPLGTPAFMSPEQARGEAHRVDGRSDVYSLGVVLYQMLTGTLPFRGETWATILKQLLYEEPQPPRRLDATIPRDLETICLKCLEKEPSRRFATAEAMAADLDRFSHGEPILARPIGWGERGARWCRKKPAVASLSMSLILVAVCAIPLYLGLRGRARASDALARVSSERARVSEKKAGKLLDSNVATLERKLEQAKSQDESLAFMSKAFREHLLKDIDELQTLLDAESSGTNGTLRLRALRALGWGYSLMEQRPKGEAALVDAIKLGEYLRSNNSQDQQLLAELASCHNLLGYVLYCEGSGANAEAHYCDAIHLCRELADDERKFSALGEYLIDQANMFRDLGRAIDARKVYAEAVALFEKRLATDPQNSRFIRGEAIALANLGGLGVPRGWNDLPASEKRSIAEASRSQFQAAILLFDRLHPDPDSTPWLAREEALCYQSLAKFERRLTNVGAAATSAARAVDQLKLVVKYHPGVAQSHYELAAANVDLAISSSKAERWTEASLAYKDAASEGAETLRISPNFPGCRRLLEGVHRNEARMLKEMREVAGKMSEPGH